MESIDITTLSKKKRCISVNRGSGGGGIRTPRLSPDFC